MDRTFTATGQAVRQGNVLLFKVSQKADVHAIVSGLPYSDIGKLTTFKRLNPPEYRNRVEGEKITVYNPSATASAKEGPYIEAESAFVLKCDGREDIVLGPGKYVCIYVAAQEPVITNLDRSLRVLDLTTNVSEVLEEAGISTLAELVVLNEETLCSLRHFNITALRQVSRKLANLNLKLGLSV